MNSDDNKTKSITMLVRSLLALTIMALVLVVALIYYMGSNTANAKAEEVMVAPCGMPTQKGDYVVGSSNGKKLFNANCSACHTVTDKAATGPGLRGVLGRIPGGEWPYNWVHNSDSLIAAGDPYAVMINEKYPARCTRFPKLTRDEIDAILGY